MLFVTDNFVNFCEVAHKLVLLYFFVYEVFNELM